MQAAIQPFSKLKNWLLNPDRLAIFGLVGLLFAFYPDLFLVTAAPLTGDHLEQHYPWAFQLAKSLKEFKLPFWTPLIHCGFPLVAESQVGAFYIPNLLMYFFLPFHVAYSYMNLVHWFIAGWGTYLYAKQMKLVPMAAFVAAVIFTFGSAYGGAYYNMTSLKTICWFPVALYFLERYLEKGHWRFLAGMALLIGQSIVAGYLQIAALTWMIFGVYAVIRIFLFSEAPLSWAKKTWTFGTLVITAIGALILAFPQIFLTFQLAMMSNRTSLQEGYAYVGSLSPLALGTLLNPHLAILSTGSNLYAGYLTLVLVLVAFLSQDVRQKPLFRLWVAVALFALLMAFGQWSPLYVAFVKLTRFYSFRVPAKFLGFFCFGLAMLGASGFQVLWEGRSSQTVVKKVFRALIWILAVYAALMASANVFLTWGRDMALKLGEGFVMRFVYAQPGHPHSLESYLATVKAYPDQILKILSWDDPANICAVIMAIVCIRLVWVFRQKKMITKILLGVAVVFLVADLYAASFQDEQLDFMLYDKVRVSSPVLKILEQEKAYGRLGRIYGFRSPNERLPLNPSQNMLYGIGDIGAYSPLVESHYYQTLGFWGNINDSNFAVTPTPAFVIQRLPVLNFLNVSHILSDERLQHPDLELVFSDPQSHVFLYANHGKHRAAHFITSAKIMEDWASLKTEFLKEGFDPAKTLLIEKKELGAVPIASDGSQDHPWTLRSLWQEADRSQWDLECSSPGFFVLSDLYYPGWKATVNGRPVKILPAFGLFRAIELRNPGTYRIEMEYHPGCCPIYRKKAL
jgi:hypothetical protein